MHEGMRNKSVYKPGILSFVSANDRQQFVVVEEITTGRVSANTHSY